MPKKFKVVIAAGGTGGHIFPAETLASDLQEQGCHVIFAGAGLDTNRYFHRTKFAHKEVMPAQRKIGPIFQGIWHSLQFLKEQKPDLVVGFGSYHSFPVLFAALCKRIPFVLFESNAAPGRVVRLLSRWARATAVQFPSARSKLSGNVVEVKMVRRAQKKSDLGAARMHYGLDPHRLTFLVFGGSQGAAAINRLFSEAISSLKDKVQVVHLAGTAENAAELEKTYATLGISAHVKPFEEQMDIAWSAADIVVCRSGSTTVAEQLSFEVPAIFIPFPRATEDHQTENAKYVENLGAALIFQEKEVDAQKLRQGVEEMIVRLPEMKNAFSKNDTQDKTDLSTFVYRIIDHG